MDLVIPIIINQGPAIFLQSNKNTNTCWTSSRSIKKVQNIKQLEQTLRLFTWTFYQVPIFRLPHATSTHYHYMISAEWKRMCARFHGKKIEGNGSCKFHDFSVHFVALVLYQISTFIPCCHDKWFWQLIFSFDKNTRNMYTYWELMEK